MLQNKGQVDLQDVIRCKNRSTCLEFVIWVFLLFVQIWKLNINLQGRILCFIKKTQSFHYFHMFHSNVSCFILMIILFMNTSNAIESVYFVGHESNYQMWAKRKDTRNTCDTRLCLHNNEILLTSVSDCRFFFSFKCWSKIKKKMHKKSLAENEKKSDLKSCLGPP